MISEMCPRVCQICISLPVLGPVLEEFITWSCQRGYSPVTLKNQLMHAKQLDAFFGELGILRISDLSHDDFEIAWNYYHRRKPSIAGTIHQIERFLEETHRLDPVLPPPKTPVDLELDRFLDHLRNVRGLAASTINHYAANLHSFLEYIGYNENTEALTGLTLKETEEFICVCSKRLSRYSLQHVVARLRAFLRFQHEQGVIESSLHTMIDTPRVYQLEKLPRSLPWKMVETLLSSIDRSNAHGIRDYTMLFLIAAYGLRPCEVVALTLDDIDWRSGSIRIPQRKTGNQLILPITDSVGDVLVDYLKRGRPDLPFRELFLRVLAPHGPLIRTAVNGAFNLRVRQSGLDIPCQGPYCLRHSYAVHLLRKGTSLKAIGDLLGHRSAESTCVYLRLATEDLRDVALPVPEEAHIDTPLEIPPLGYRVNPRCRNGTKPPAGSAGPLGSFLSGDIEDYLNLRRSLGRKCRNEANTFRSFDSFLATHYPQAEDLTGEMFDKWSLTLRHLAPTGRRKSMQVVRNLLLYHKRSHPRSLVPDPQTFPAPHQPVKPYIFSESDIGRLLCATKYLRPTTRSPLRAEAIRIAIILLYTTGLRRGELLPLRLGDFKSDEETLDINATKFHKSRIIPLSRSAAGELADFLALRREKRLPVETESPLLWNGYGGPEGGGYSDNALAHNLAALCASLHVFTDKGRTPRIHDLRHSFAVNALLRWYEAGEDVGAKLPMLATYMGHVSIASTHYYLPFVEGIRSEASTRFEQSFGSAVTTAAFKPEQE